MIKCCFQCTRSLEKRSRSEYREVNNSILCLQCYRKNSRQHETSSETPNTQGNTSTNETNNDVRITLPLLRINQSRSKCILCQRTDRAMRRLSRAECIEIYIKSRRNVFVVYGARVCNSHNENELSALSENLSDTYNGLSLNAEEIVASFETMKNLVLSERNTDSVTLFLNMSNDMLIFETGLDHKHFHELLDLLKNETLLHVRHAEFSLGVYLSRLRRGYTFEELAVRWKITRQTASSNCEQIRQALVKSFCSKYISFSLDRNDFITHQSPIAKQIFGPSGNRIILVWDGTYIFIQKSSNFSFQRDTYSGHKHRNLIKPMMAVLTDGYIAGVFGPYPGSKNDASILNELLTKNMWDSFEPGDIFLVDRGFRDSINKIIEKGFVAKMPEFADKPSAALTTDQANRSRLVTKNRFIVEVINGRIKEKFKYFGSIIQNSTIPTLFDDFKIACALLNLTFKPLVVSDHDNLIVERMIQFSNANNHLSQLIEKENLNARTSNFRRIETSQIDFFPTLDISQLQLYTCGTYQIKVAHSYYADHINEIGDFEFEVAKETTTIDYPAYSILLAPENSLLIKTRLRSRHSNSTKYFVYLLIDKTKQGLEAVIGHTCGCKIGKRVVGCCSHVAMVLWYFGYARHQSTILIPGQHVIGYFDQNDLSSDEDDLINE